ncbi:MAG: hypothetical protein J4G05_10250 [Chlorobi bacterium]|nr:hypothetical protein [Chlorobiota bacterium]
MKIYSASRILFHFPLLLFFLVVSQNLDAQEVYRLSWTLQNTDENFHQQLASDIIDSLNLWLTRDNPEAATARLDDNLRITITGFYDPITDQIQERIVRVKVGNQIITDDATLFLDGDIIDSLLRRNYFWSEEGIEPLDQSLTPEYYQSSFSSDRPDYPSYEHTFFNRSTGTELSLDNTRIPLTGNIKLFGGLGFEGVGMPLLSYHRARLGIEHGTFWAWYEAPLGLEQLGSLVGGKNTAAHGAGMSFDLMHIGGSATFSNRNQILGTNSATPSLMSKSATLYGTLPVSWISSLKGWFRIKAGAGLIEATTLRRDSANQYITTGSSLTPQLLVRGELRFLRSDGTLHRTATLQLFGETLSVSWFERFSNLFGLRAGFSLHGLLGEEAFFETQQTIWATPVIFLN